MRARLTIKLMGLVVMLVLTVVTARSCNRSPASSPLNPNTVLRNGVAGLCANQEATAAAGGGDGAASTLAVPAADVGMAAAAGLSTGALSCTSTTLAGP